jgi:transcriptional regulator with XRE-family HTH domain
MTQQALSDKVGCTWEAVSRWERGQREPGWSQIQALADALGVSCDAFRVPPGDGEPTRMGRPSRPRAEAEKPKRPRGRPKKGEV